MKKVILTLPPGYPHSMSYYQVFVNPFAAGEIIVRNITVDRFVPPNIRFRLNNNSLQMLTHSGYVQAAADWELRSELLSVLEVPLMGTIRIQMTGLISEIDMANVTPDRLEVSNCVARIRDLRLNLHGSVVANVLQLFRASFVKGIRRKLEEVDLSRSKSTCSHDTCQEGQSSKGKRKSYWQAQEIETGDLQL
ncbi:hypothetical protein COOONC_27106 [Cooperia oncophora]